MYSTLLVVHSLFRWLVLGTLLVSVYRAFVGYTARQNFSASDNALRHWTATVAHVQLTIGLILYIKSPITHYFWQYPAEGLRQANLFFFGLIHIVLMFVAVIIVTIGSALAKRKASHEDKYRTMVRWFSVCLILILLAIPWPSLPWSRPLYRAF